MTIKAIRWFEVTTGVPAAFHNPSGDVVCLNYKDYDNRSDGVEPWFLTHEIVVVPLISDWGNEPWWDVLKEGAQGMVDYAALNASSGFKNGDFYGIYWVSDLNRLSPPVHVGLAYASTERPLVPVRGIKELPVRAEIDLVYKDWVTPQFSIPLMFDVRLPEDKPRVIHRVSRYKRSPVI